MDKINLAYRYIFCLSLLSGLLIFACKSGEPAVAESKKELAPASKLENSLLWEISGNGLEKSSFLFGTIHIIGEEDFFLPPGTLAAIDQSDQVVFEINMEDMMDLSKQMSLLNKAFMDDNLSLKDLLTPKDYDMVKAHFEEIGLPIFLFERMKPMFLTVFSSGDMSPSDFQSGRIKSYEMEFMEMANQSNKNMGGLETLDFQMSVFDSIPYSDQAKMLVESIQATNTEGDIFKEMVDVYKSQDIDKMYEMFSREEGGLEGYENLLVNDRNRNWIPIMREMIRNGPVFFAVGAGHLGGEEGVVRLLRKEGYALKPYVQRKI